jgi:hypothetical protein
MITEAQLGWMAAVLDMKGHIYHKQTDSRHGVIVTLIVDSSKTEVIMKLSEMTGGNLDRARSKQEWTRRGCVQHCGESHNHVVTQPGTQRWAVNGITACIVLHGVLPYIQTVSKGWHEAYAETLARSRISGQGSGATRPAIARMLRLGWQLPPYISRLLAEADAEELASA